MRQEDRSALPTEMTASSHSLRPQRRPGHSATPLQARGTQVGLKSEPKCYGDMVQEARSCWLEDQEGPGEMLVPEAAPGGVCFLIEEGTHIRLREEKGKVQASRGGSRSSEEGDICGI